MDKNLNHVMIDVNEWDNSITSSTYPIVYVGDDYILVEKESIKHPYTIMKEDLNQVTGLGNDTGNPYYSDRYSMVSDTYSIEKMIDEIVKKIVADANERGYWANADLESAMSYSGYIEELVSKIKEK